MRALGKRVAEARLELRREADLRHQHQRLLPALEHPRDQAQVDLGLAAAGDAVQQERLEAAERGADPLDGLRLVRGSAAWPGDEARRRRHRHRRRAMRFFGSGLSERRRGGSAPITVSPSGRW